MLLKNVRAIVTGAASGLGWTFSLALVSAGLTLSQEILAPPDWINSEQNAWTNLDA